MKFNKELNHTTSHILAMAVLKLFPDTILGFGPPTKEGFYYDFKFANPLLESDLVKIEKQMKKIVANAFVMNKKDTDYKYDFSPQPLKKELNDEFISQGKNVTFYSIIDPNLNKDLFVDLCAGGHIDKIKDVKHFKLLSLSGAY
jgi:threonyl-tRNA synthetase